MVTFKQLFVHDFSLVQQGNKPNKLMKRILFLVLMLISGVSMSQITVQNTQTPQQLVQNVLAGNGVQISNVAINGLTSSVVQFNPMQLISKPMLIVSNFQFTTEFY